MRQLSVLGNSSVVLSSSDLFTRVSCARGRLRARGAHAFSLPAANCQVVLNVRTTVVCMLGSTRAVRATLAGTPCTTARPPVRSRTARAPPVVPTGATPAAAASAGVAAIGGGRYETFSRVGRRGTYAHGDTDTQLDNNLHTDTLQSGTLTFIFTLGRRHHAAQSRRARSSRGRCRIMCRMRIICSSHASTSRVTSRGTSAAPTA